MRIINAPATPPVIVGSVDERLALAASNSITPIIHSTKFIDYYGSVFFWGSTRSVWSEVEIMPDGTTQGSSASVHDMPTASVFGDGKWTVNGVDEYLSNGTAWTSTPIALADPVVLNSVPLAVIPVSGTLSSKGNTNLLISGYGATFSTTEDLKFSHINIKKLAQTTAAGTDFWQTITVNVRATDKNGAIVASGTFSTTPYAATYSDALVELWSGGLPKTLTVDDLGATYWVEYVATNRDGGRAPVGFSDTTVAPSNQLLPAVGNNTGYQLKANGTWSITAGFDKYYFAIEPFYYSATEETPTAKQISSELFLPPIYAVVGRECNVYFDGLTSISFDKLGWDVTCAIGTHQNERFTVTPATASASTALTISAIDPATLDVVATKAGTIQVAAAAAAGTLTCLFIGDSTTANGEVVTEVNVLATADADLAITMLGTKGTGANIHEGIAGWTSTLFTTTGSPFFVGGKIDFAGYMTANSYAGVDRVIINLGINDVFSATTDDAAKVSADTCINNIGKLITSIQSYSSTCHIGLAITTPPSINQDAFGKSYDSGQTYYRYKRNLSILYSKLLAKFSGKTASKLWLLPYNVSLDTVNNMIVETVAVNSRNSATVVRQANGVHPAASGYLQIADAAYAWIKCTL
ncbi:MAG: SGNH/GDSL hydrolase family protein [Taibaiella sp.]|jgi:lysophospholipase L1-like esterase